MKGEKGFDDAQKDMQEAEGDLKGDQGDQAGRARRSPKGNRARARRSTHRVARSRRSAKGRRACRSRWARARTARADTQPAEKGPASNQGDDPLGRGREGNMGREEGSLRETAGGAERARRVLEELRRRLADPNRPVDERDYLERLMKHD